MGLVTATGNVIGGNVLTAGIMSSTGNAIHGNILTAGLISATGNIIGGNLSSTGGIYANAGTLTTAPLTFGNSTFLTMTANLGAMEFSNNTLYFTTFTGNRGLVSTSLFRTTNSNIATTNVATGQSWLGVGVTLNANTTYQFTGQFYVTTINTTSHVEQVGFGGTATLANIAYQVTRANAVLGSANTTNSSATQYFFANTLSNITTAITTAQNSVITMSGIVSTTATGTFIPQWATNVAISTTGVFTRGSYFQLTPVGQGNANISIGTWA